MVSWQWQFLETFYSYAFLIFPNFLKKGINLLRIENTISKEELNETLQTSSKPEYDFIREMMKFE